MTPWVPMSQDEARAAQVDALDDIDTWLLSDAWVLAAVRVTGTDDLPARLVDVIIAADAVNHLVLSRKEIEHAISRLVPAGLVQIDYRGFVISWVGRRVVASARGEAPQRMSALFDLLLEIDVPGRPWSLEEREYENAILEYRHTVFEGYRRETRQLRRFGRLG